MASKELDTMRCVVVEGEVVQRGVRERIRGPRVAVHERPSVLPGHGEVLVQPLSIGICGSDYHACRTDPDGFVLFSGPMRVPTVLGHELCGRVTAVGLGVVGLEVGDLVVPETVFVCGQCGPCQGLRPNQCSSAELLGLTIDGVMAESVVLPAKHCFLVGPSGTASQLPSSAYDLLTLAEPLACVLNGFRDLAADPTQERNVLVVGLGPIGLMAAIWAKSAFGCRVVGLERSLFRCSLARGLGLELVVEKDVTVENAEEVAERAQALVGGRFDIIVEAAGVSGGSLPGILSGLGAKGALLYFARRGELLQLPADELVTRSWRVVGSRGPNGGAIRAASVFLLREYQRLQGAVTLTVGFDEVVETLVGMDYLRQGKVVFRPTWRGR